MNVLLGTVSGRKTRRAARPGPRVRPLSKSITDPAAEAGRGTFAALYRRFPRREEGPGRAEACDSLRKILSGATALDLFRFDSSCRRRASVEWRKEWADFDPDGFCRDGTGAEGKVWGYGLASFHPNGYLREKAVAGLASIETGEELAFLLLRLGDWVDRIRIRAESAVAARLASPRGDMSVCFLRNLPILQRLRAAERLSHAPILERIGKRIASDENALLSGLASADKETRRFCFASALGSEGIALETLQNYVLAEPLGSVRLNALRGLENRLAFPQAGGFVGRLLRDSFPPVRRLALDIRCKHALDESGDVLREMVLSMNGGLRRSARHYMILSDRERPAALYRRALANGDGIAVVGALRGLGEVGERQDAERIHPFLKHERAVVVRAAIRSLGSLQAGYLATLLAPFVSDARPGVSREAYLALKSRTSGLNPEKLNAARISASLPHVRKHILMLLFAIGFWESLPFILEALAEAQKPEEKPEEKPGIKAEEKTGQKALQKEMAGKALARWIFRSDSHFIEPGKGQKEKCAEALARFGHVLDEKRRKTLALILR